ncbi:MAG: C25 family cysteine peptidase, partial [Candidatus Thermoplasmatota archaeon]
MEELLRVEYKFSNLRIIQIKGLDLKEYHYLKFSEADDVCIASPGLPALPTKGAKILLPYGKEIKEINVIGHGKVELLGKYTIYPVQRAVKLTVKPEDVLFVEPDAKIYSSLDVYPSELYTLGSVQTFRGYRILLLTLHPAHYIPRKGMVFYYTSLEVKLTLTDSKTSQTTTFRGLPEDEAEVKEIVDNPGVAVTYNAAKTSTAGSSKAPKGGAIPSGTWEYVIITNESLTSTYQLLANHRNTTGVNATVVTVEWILSTPYYATTPYTAVDDQTKIRNFITDAYNNWSTRYVLLGRDHSKDASIPPNTRIQAREIIVQETEFDRIPCDLYYGGLDGNWDGNGNGKYGEYLDPIDEADLYAEVYIGRVPSDTEVQAYNFVQKVIGYENQSSTESYLLTALMIGEKLDDTPTWGSDAKDVIASMLPENYAIKNLSDKDGTYSSAQVENELSYNTPHIVNHVGHASPSSVAGLSEDACNRLINSKYFLFYSQGCNAGRFTYHPTSAAIDSIGEDLILYKNCSFAFIGNSYYGYYYSGSGVVNGPSQKYDKEFFKKVFGDEIYHIGK